MPRRIPASMIGALVLFGLLTTTASAGTALSRSPDERSGDTVRFELGAVSGPGSDRTFRLELRCDGDVEARATLAYPDQTSTTVRHDAAGESCRVAQSSSPVSGRVDEVTHTVSRGEDTLARRTWYTDQAGGRSSEFRVPAEPGADRLAVRVDARSLASDEVGVPVRAMAFNIWASGTLSDAPGGERNLRELIEFVRKHDPDILFMVEVNGSGQRILNGLNEGLPRERRYTGHRITREPGQGQDEDRLWLFTRFQVEKVYQRRAGGDLTSENFGGARLKLPNGQRLHAFPTWLTAADKALAWTNQSALEDVLGVERTYTDAELIAADDQRAAMVETLLNERLPEYLATDPEYADAPVILAGDLNALSALDWSERFAQASGHRGLVLDWPATGMFDEAGFVDTYRWANPDAARYPGRTWSPLSGFGYAPGRIDYLMTRGEQVRVLDSYTVTRRLPKHRGSELDEAYPFYSDHGAVVSDLLVRGPGAAEPRPYRTDEPDDDPIAWPDAPPGTPVPVAELSATASSEQAETGMAGLAVDGDYTTHWHSRYSPELDPHPHEITIDVGTERKLSALRYQPRIVGTSNGTWTSGRLLASADGEAWQEITRFDWAPTPAPKDVELSGLSARYLRFEVAWGLGAFSSAAEIIPYEAGR